MSFNRIKNVIYNTCPLPIPLLGKQHNAEYNKGVRRNERKVEGKNGFSLFPFTSSFHSSLYFQIIFACIVATSCPANGLFFKFSPLSEDLINSIQSQLSQSPLSTLSIHVSFFKKVAEIRSLYFLPLGLRQRLSVKILAQFQLYGLTVSPIWIFRNNCQTKSNDSLIFPKGKVKKQKIFRL